MLIKNYDQKKGFIDSVTYKMNPNIIKKTSYISNPRLQQLKQKIMAQRVKKLQDNFDDQQLQIQEKNQEQEKMIKIFFNINQDFKQMSYQLINKQESQNSLSETEEYENVQPEKPKIKFTTHQRIKDYSINNNNKPLTQSSKVLDRKSHNKIKSLPKKIDPFFKTEQNFYSKIQNLQQNQEQESIKTDDKNSNKSQFRKKIEQQISKSQFKLDQISNNDQKLKQFKEQFTQYQKFLQKINISNNQIILNNQEITYFRVYVGKGNNNAVIESVFRKRWWWRVVDYQDKDDCHCIWTQLKKQNILDNQESLQHQQFFDQIKNYQKNDAFDNQLVKIFNENETDFILEIKQKNKYQQIENQIQQSKPNFRTIKKHIKQKSHNHIDKNFHLGNKKLLFYNIKNYCESINENPFDYIPVTFHIQNGVDDPEYKNFLKFYKKRAKQIRKWENLSDKQKQNQRQPRNIYIIKPGEITNRGFGISVENDIQSINQTLQKQQSYKDGGIKTYIVQLYIDRPLLYNKRKFDIRCFMLVTSQNGIMKAYWFQEGYVRTSCQYFNLRNLKNKMQHLTNDAIQNKSEEYGKFENGNKLSYKEFDKYLQQNYGQPFFGEIHQNMKKISQIAIKSVYGQIDPKKRDNTFEIFGLDYMIDEDFKVYLIEINTNPCFEFSSTLLARIIPDMINNALNIAIDTIFPPPDFTKQLIKNQSNKIFVQNKFELIFDELVDGKNLKFNRENNFIEQKIYQIQEEEDDDEEEEQDDDEENQDDDEENQDQNENQDNENQNENQENQDNEDQNENQENQDNEDQNEDENVIKNEELSLNID